MTVREQELKQEIDRLNAKLDRLVALSYDAPEGYKNATELKYAQSLELSRRAGLIRSWGYELWKFKLGQGAWFTPDFFVFENSGQIRISEVKGFWREAARVRIKCAAALYPMFHWEGVRKSKHGWETEKF